MTEENADGRSSGGAVLVAGPPSPLAARLAAELTAGGVVTGLLGGAEQDGVPSLPGSVNDREAAIDAVAAAEASLGSVAMVVYVPAVEGGLQDRLLVDTDESRWDAEAEAPVRSAYFVIQGAHELFAERGGSIALMIPSIALTGAAGLVPFATAAEGIRLLGKSAARAWGKRRITVNSLTVPIEAWDFEQAPEHAVPNRYGPSMTDSDVVKDAAGAIALLANPLSSGVTGSTIGIDLGTVMAP